MHSSIELELPPLATSYFITWEPGVLNIQQFLLKCIELFISYCWWVTLRLLVIVIHDNGKILQSTEYRVYRVSSKTQFWILQLFIVHKLSAPLTIVLLLLLLPSAPAPAPEPPFFSCIAHCALLHDISTSCMTGTGTDTRGNARILELFWFW